MSRTTRQVPRSGPGAGKTARRVLVALALVGAMAVPVGAAPAAAKAAPRLGGSIRCTLQSGLLTFDPALRDRVNLADDSKHRGPSNGVFTATASGCTDPSLGPAPGGIDHGTLTGATHVAGSYCPGPTDVRIRRTEVAWFAADGTPLGSTRMKLVLTIAKSPDWTQPWVLHFTGTTPRHAKVFPSGTVSSSAPTVQAGMGMSIACFKFELESLSLADSPIAVDAP